MRLRNCFVPLKRSETLHSNNFRFHWASCILCFCPNNSWYFIPLEQLAYVQCIKYNQQRILN